jgi:hypothetical protein
MLKAEKTPMRIKRMDFHSLRKRNKKLDRRGEKQIQNHNGFSF